MRDNRTTQYPLGAWNDNMKEPTFLEDLREVRENWHDPEYRQGFLSAFWPAFLKRFLPNVLIGVLAGYALSRLFA